MVACTLPGEGVVVVAVVAASRDVGFHLSLSLWFLEV